MSRVSVNDLVPREYQTIFLSRFDKFNDMQSIVAAEAIRTDVSLTIHLNLCARDNN
jgi:hypothetical protein